MARTSKNEAETRSSSTPKKASRHGKSSKSAPSKTNAAKTILLDIVYLVDGDLVRTNQLMKGQVQPIGVVIPYVAEHGQNREFIVYYDDEHAMLSYNAAKVYAWHRLPCYQGNHWRVKNAMDDARMRTILPVVNELCRKMGGKSIKGKYIDGQNVRDQKVTPQHKIRYVCDIKL